MGSPNPENLAVNFSRRSILALLAAIPLAPLAKHLKPAAPAAQAGEIAMTNGSILGFSDYDLSETAQIARETWEALARGDHPFGPSPRPEAIHRA